MATRMTMITAENTRRNLQDMHLLQNVLEARGYKARVVVDFEIRMVTSAPVQVAEIEALNWGCGV